MRNHHQHFLSIQFHAGIIACSLIECLVMIHLKSAKEIETMESASKIVAEILLA